MSEIFALCESHEIEYVPLMEAVEEFVDSLVESASPELYQATAKRLLGETLSHDEIMLDVPYCSRNDLIVVSERAPNSVDGVKYHVGLDTQVRNLMIKLRLGRKGMNMLFDIFQELLDKYPHKDDYHLMAKAGQRMGIGPKDSQILLTKFMQKGGHLKEYYLNMAEEALSEEAPTNTSGSATPDHKPTDTGKMRLGKQKPTRRKKLEDEEE